MSPKVMASLSAFGGDYPSCLYSYPPFGRICPMVQCLYELSPCVSSMFVCSSGDLVVHLFQGGRG